MKNRFSHIIPLFLPALLLLPFTGMFVLQLAQWYLKETATDRMSRHEIVTRSLPVSKVVWHKEKKELAIDGQMFDVKQAHISGEILTVTGYFDEEEESMLYFLSLLTGKNKNTALLHFLLVLQSFFAPLLFFSLAFIIAERIVHRTLFISFLLQPVCMLIKHPPK